MSDGKESKEIVKKYQAAYLKIFAEHSTVFRNYDGHFIYFLHFFAAVLFQIQRTGKFLNVLQVIFLHKTMHRHSSFSFTITYLDITLEVILKVILKQCV